jgi:hypothetical protein
MTFTAPICTPAWAYPAALMLFGVLLIALALLCRRRERRMDFDPHGEAYGDQPQVPL